jgi:ATP-dependent Lon protease
MDSDSTFSEETFAELPLFPLPVVLFPDAPLPLHIFEERYKLMINTLIDEGVEGEMKPFGVVLWDGESAGVAETGCTARILEVKRLPEGKMNLVTVGMRRFKIIDVIEEQPYIIAKIEYQSDPSAGEKGKLLAGEIKGTLVEILRLSSRLADKEFAITGDVPDDPAQLSWWVAANFYGSPTDPHALLEIGEPEKRLEEELLVLNAAKKHLAAKVSLKNALG